MASSYVVTPAAEAPKRTYTILRVSPGSYTPHNAREAISPVDGKTHTCDRNVTFDTIVEEGKIAEDDQQKKVGHGWEVLRALLRIKKPAKKTATVVRSVSVRSKRGMGSVREKGFGSVRSSRRMEVGQYDGFEKL